MYLFPVLQEVTSMSSVLSEEVSLLSLILPASRDDVCVAGSGASQRRSVVTDHRLQEDAH